MAGKASIVKHLGLVALLPAMTVSALLLASAGPSPTSDSGPSVVMTVTPVR